MRSQKTVSSYRGIFNRMGLPIPRSVRVKVDYNIVIQDPKIAKELKETINKKSVIGH